jgi:hypothetical protein
MVPFAIAKFSLEVELAGYRRFYPSQHGSKASYFLALLFALRCKNIREMENISCLLWKL